MRLSASDISRLQGERIGVGFQDISPEEYAKHAAITHCGDFALTGAVVPSYNFQVVPTEGFRFMEQGVIEGSPLVHYIASVSREKIIPLFVELSSLLHREVSMSMHYTNVGNGIAAVQRLNVPLQDVSRFLRRYEDVILGDGFLSFSVHNQEGEEDSDVFGLEIEDHKLIYVGGHQLASAGRILDSHGVHKRHDMDFVIDAEHMHASSHELIRKRCRMHKDMIDLKMRF